MKYMFLAGPGLLLILAAAGFAKEYAGPDGFGFAYPDAWLLVPKGQSNPAVEQAMARFNISRSILDNPNLQAFIFNPADDGYAEKIILSILPRCLRLDTKSVEQFVQEDLNSPLSAGGAKIQRQEVTRISVAGLESLSVLSYLEQPQSHEESTLWGVAIPAGKNLISFSFVSTTGEFEAHRPIFQQVIDSCRLGRQESGGGLLGGLPQPMRDSITYGSIVLGVLLLVWSLRRMRRLREARSAQHP